VVPNPLVLPSKHSRFLGEKKVNKKWLTERLLYHMEVAKEELARRRRVEANDEFIQTAILILPDGTEQELSLAFYDCCEQKICMSELSAACLGLDASALIIRARALLLNTDRIKKELDVDGGDRIARRAAIVRWVKKKTRDGRVVSLPSEYQKWCLLVLGLGPRLPSIGLVQYYDRRSNETIFIGQPALSLGFEFPLIRKWWQ
jgi:hypothetical protein